MSEMPELIIFDCDGVLIDSEIIGINLTLKLMATYGVRIDFNEFSAELSGLSWHELIDKIQERNGVILPESLYDTFKVLLLKQFAEKLTSTPGTLEIIQSLPFPKCICSNSSRDQLAYSLSLVGLSKFFSQRIFSAIDLGPGHAKPKPDIFLHAANVLKAAPENTLVIEDSVHGVTAACRAGMRVIGYIGGAHSYPLHELKLISAGATQVIDSMSKLPEVIAQLTYTTKRGLKL